MDDFHHYEEALTMLERHVNALTEEYRPYLECRKGCSACCEKATFKIRLVEALYLLQGLRQATPEVREAVRKNLANGDPLHCPFLIDNACSVYLHRPTLCRAYGLIVEVNSVVATCPLNFIDPPENLPMKAITLDPYYEICEDVSRQLRERFEKTAEQTDSLKAFPEKATIRDYLSYFEENGLLGGP